MQCEVSLAAVCFLAALFVQRATFAQSAGDAEQWFRQQLALGKNYPVLGENELVFTVTRYCPITKEQVERLRPIVRNAVDHPDGYCVGWYDTEQREGPEKLTLRYWCRDEQSVRVSESGGRTYVNPYQPQADEPDTRIRFGKAGRDKIRDYGMNSKDAWVLETADLRVDSMRAGVVQQSHASEDGSSVVTTRVAEVHGWVCCLMQWGLAYQLDATKQITSCISQAPDIYMLTVEVLLPSGLMQVDYTVCYLRQFDDFVLQQREVVRAPFDLSDYPRRKTVFTSFQRDSTTGRVLPRVAETSGSSFWPREVVELQSLGSSAVDVASPLFATPKIPQGSDLIRGNYVLNTVHDLRNHKITNYDSDGSIHDYHAAIEGLRPSHYGTLAWVSGAIALGVLGVVGIRKHR